MLIHCNLLNTDIRSDFEWCILKQSESLFKAHPNRRSFHAIPTPLGQHLNLTISWFIGYIRESKYLEQGEK